MLTTHDTEILRPLLCRYAEIAALPIHEEKRRLWQDHNELRAARPMILIDQVCWEQLNVKGCLDTHCEDPYWQGVEERLRRDIYAWEHFPVDMVFNPYLSLPKPLSNTGWGVEIEKKILTTETSDIVSQEYTDVLATEEDLEKLQMPEISLDEARQKEIEEEAAVLCQGILPYCMEGTCLHLGLWDHISFRRGVTNCYLDLLDRPEFIHAIMEKMTRGILHQIETINRLGCYDVTSHTTHCSKTFLDHVPGPEYDPAHGTTHDGWAFGMAQLFTSVSPDITAEFEVPYMNRLFPHFGGIYYGCCERLDDRLDVISRLKNVRKISCSPWSDRDHFAEVLPDRYIMSAKPNPAFLAGKTFDEEVVRKDLRHTMDAARRSHHNVELLQKDISTIGSDPARLERWAQIAMEEAMR